MFDQGNFKVNVIVQGQTDSEHISSPICIFWTIAGILRTNLKLHNFL